MHRHKEKDSKTYDTLLLFFDRVLHPVVVVHHIRHGKSEQHKS
jgi:hypothetical protein